MKVSLEDGQRLFTKPTIEDQIAEVGREIGLRKNVYPSFVARGKMQQDEADEHQRRMEAVYATLKWVQKNAEAIKKAVEAKE